ncbi:TraY domain-containing protein [Bradyrhizobium japonicum]|nr:TraY domain-containing protein [Bradyrhizobium japonicum]
MAEKEQEHLRIRLGAKLLKRIDAARERSGRTRTDEIEARLIESFTRLEMQEVAQIAAREMIVELERRARELNAQKDQVVDFYDALMGRKDGK